MLRKLLLAAGATAIALAAVELVIRVAGLGVHAEQNDWRKYNLSVEWDGAGGYYRHRPNESLEMGGIHMDFNSLGVRDREPPPKTPGTTRILCLGDSVTFGAGVPWELTYPQRLAAMLGPAGDVVTAAVGGWNTVQEARFLARNVDRLAPDVVVLLYVINDNERIDPWFVARQPIENWRTWIHRHLVMQSRLYEWASWLYVARIKDVDWPAIIHMNEQRRAEAGAPPPFTDADPGWLESRAALGRIVDVSRAHGARVVFFMWNLGRYPPGDTALARLREVGAERGVPVYDTAQLYDRYWEFVNNPYADPHPNAAGHERLAAEVARVLRAEGWVPAGRPSSGMH
jgi:lysophospholipase L1-like esterase